MPILTCTVTGRVLAPDGTPVGAGTLRFWPALGVVQPSFDNTATIAPKAAEAAIDDIGEIRIALNPGIYNAAIYDAIGRIAYRTFRVAIPAIPTALLQDLTDGLAPIPISDRVPSGTEGQVVGYGPGGVPMAIVLPDGTLPAGAPGQIVGFDADGLPVAVDAPVGGGDDYDDSPLVARIAAIETAVADLPEGYDDAALLDALQGLRNDLDALPAAYDPEPLVARVEALEAALADVPAAYDDGPLVERVGALEDIPPVTWMTLTEKPVAFPPGAHSHAWTEITGKPTTFAPDAHTHAWADITSKPETFVPSAHAHTWTEITEKPTTFAPAAHTHEIANVNGLADALAATGGGNSVTITTVNTQADFDAATPGPLEIVVRVA